MVSRCPWCQAEGTVGLGNVRRSFTALPPGGSSLAGGKLKVTAQEQWTGVMSCSACGRQETGRLDGVQVNVRGEITSGHFIPDDQTSAS